jgi:putative phosphoribosyl transferase
MRFVDREDAGGYLAEQLMRFAGRTDVIVLALPRGGVPVAFEVAEAIGAPLDVFVVRKLGVPGHEELAMGAIASGNVQVLDDDVCRAFGVSPAAVARVVADERRELQRRELLYRGARPVPDLRGRIVILVDDGLATGSTMVAAVRAVRKLDPARIIVAVPVAPPEACAMILREADECECVTTHSPFFGVGAWYSEFGQTSDDEVSTLLAAAVPTPELSRNGP